MGSEQARRKLLLIKCEIKLWHSLLWDVVSRKAYMGAREGCQNSGKGGYKISLNVWVPKSQVVILPQNTAHLSSSWSAAGCYWSKAAGLMDFSSGLQGPSLCCHKYSGTPNRNKSPRTGTNHPGWARCLTVTETMSVSVNLYRATCKLVKFFPCKLKASVLLSRKPFNFQPKLILIS